MQPEQKYLEYFFYLPTDGDYSTQSLYNFCSVNVNTVEQENFATLNFREFQG